MARLKTHNLYIICMEYHRSNKSPLCGLTPTPIATQIRYSYYIFLSQVWEEEVSLIWLDHSGSQPFNYIHHYGDKNTMADGRQVRFENACFTYMAFSCNSRTHSPVSMFHNLVKEKSFHKTCSRIHIYSIAYSGWGLLSITTPPGPTSQKV